MTFVNFSYGLMIIIVNTIFLNAVTAGNVSTTATIVDPPKSCYAMAVYNELIKVIDTLNARTRHANPDLGTLSSQNVHLPNLKKLQDDEDTVDITDIVEGGELAAILPMIFKVVGSALSLNSSGIADNSLGLIPPGLSNQITSVLGSLANNILGVPPPKNPPRPPPIRRRRRTTTTENAMTSDLNTTMSLVIVEPIDATNSTTLHTPFMEEQDNNTIGSTTEEISTQPTSTTAKALFPESFLGEIPVYAAAYAPNYIQTTSYPVYASNFLHILYPAPTTVPTTSASESTESLYAIALPFESPDETKTISSTTLINKEELLNTTPDEYEYEEATDNKLRENMEVLRDFQAAEDFRSTVKAGVVMAEDEDDEYLDKDANTNRSLGRVGRFF